jgi:hypothetical protein
MSRSNPLITVGKLTFTVEEAEELIMHALDMEQNVPTQYSPSAALKDLSRIVNKVKARNGVDGPVI